MPEGLFDLFKKKKPKPTGAALSAEEALSQGLTYEFGPDKKQYIRGTSQLAGVEPAIAGTPEEFAPARAPGATPGTAIANVLERIAPGQLSTPTTTGGTSTLSFEQKLAALEQAAAADMPLPPGIIVVTDADYNLEGGLINEPGVLWQYWNDLRALRERQAGAVFKEREFGLKEQEFAERRAQQERTAAATQAQAEQIFLLSLLQNPGAMAAFQMLRGAGAQPFLFGGGAGGATPQFSGIPRPFGFNPITASPAGVNPETGESEVEPGLLPIGSSIGSFFGQGAVPRLNEMGANPQGLQALEGLLALFGIMPEQLQQASARETPRPFMGTRASFALPAPRR